MLYSKQGSAETAERKYLDNKFLHNLHSHSMQIPTDTPSATTKRVYPPLFHRILALKIDDMSKHEFIAPLYQFTKMCWEDDSLVRLWVSSPLSAQYDPTEVTLKYPIDLYMLYYIIVGNGGSDKITHLNRWNEVGKTFQLDAEYIKLAWEHYLHPYEVYSAMVKAYFWGFVISPTGSETESLGREVVYDGYYWSGTERWYRNESTRRFLNLTPHPLVGYEEELDGLLESIKASRKERAGELIFRNKSLHLMPTPKPIHPRDIIGKGEIAPDDTASQCGFPWKSEPYTGTAVAGAFTREILAIHSSPDQTTVENMDEEARFARKWTPPPHPILLVSEAADHFRGTYRAELDEDTHFASLAAADVLELEIKYGLKPYDLRKEEFRPHLGPKKDFGEWISQHGIELAKYVWREWMRQDPGLEINN
jgi:hypothetical protein